VTGSGAPAHGGCTVAILTGGRARRLGGLDKASLVLEGRRFIDRIADEARRVAEDVFIVTNDASRHGDLGLPCWPDRVPGIGALGGLYTALGISRTSTTLVVACDLPLVTATLLGWLADARVAGLDAVVPASADAPQPLCAAYRTACAATLKAVIDRGERSVRKALDELHVRYVALTELAALGVPLTVLLNVNTPADLELARQLSSHATARPGDRQQTDPPS